MIRTGRLILSVALLLTFFSNLAQASPQPFSLVLDSRLMTLKRGAELKVRVTLQNVSNRPISISESVGETQFQYLLEVYNSQGAALPETDRARKLRGAITSSDVVHTLQPGETLQNELTLTGLYDLSRPGKYVVQVSRSIPKGLGSGVIKSNRISVLVVD